MISPVTETSREEGRHPDVPLQTQGAGTSGDDFMQTAAADHQSQARMPMMQNQPAPQPMHVRSAGQSPVNTSYLTGFEQEYNAHRNVVQDLAFPITESPLPSATPGSDFSQRRPESNPEISGSLSNQNEQEGFHDIFSELMIGTEHEVSFLTRHFSEFLGPWYVVVIWISTNPLMLISTGWTYRTLRDFSQFMPPFAHSIMIS